MTGNDCSEKTDTLLLDKRRQSNIELFRIITMLLIVAHHSVVNSGLIDAMDEAAFDGKTLFYLIWGAWGKVGINCFVLITGYFMCQSKATIRKFLKLFFEVEFYLIVVYIVFILTGIDSVGLGRILKVLIPIRVAKSNFTGCFLLFYLLIPFLNKLLSTLDRTWHFLLVALLIFIYTILGTLEVFQAELFGVTFNYVSWFIVLYFIGAYIRLYGAGRMEKNTGFKLVFWIAIAILSILVFAKRSRIYGENIYMSYAMLSDSNKAIALLIAVYSFLFFKNLKIGYSPTINKIAASTFGVLLIHANSDAMRHWLWRDLLHIEEMYLLPYGILHIVLSVLVIFSVCTIADILRIRLIERPFFRLYDQHEAQILQSGRKLLLHASDYANRGVNSLLILTAYS